LADEDIRALIALLRNAGSSADMAQALNDCAAPSLPAAIQIASEDERPEPILNYSQRIILNLRKI
jgi:hypothetical protein